MATDKTANKKRRWKKWINKMKYNDKGFGHIGFGRMDNYGIKRTLHKKRKSMPYICSS